MTMQSTVADMLVRIRNAQNMGHKEVAMPLSKLKQSIAVVLQDEGYIKGFGMSDEANPAERQLTVQLKYYQGKPVISELHLVSRPGLRNYCGTGDIPKVKNDYGITIVSTSHGVMTGQKARAAGIGGEVICTVF